MQAFYIFLATDNKQRTTNTSSGRQSILSNFGDTFESSSAQTKTIAFGPPIIAWRGKPDTSILVFIGIIIGHYIIPFRM
jgi:hypothetical protein